MIWATDLPGLNFIRTSNAIYDCGTVLEEGTLKDRIKGRKELINRYELGLSSAILEKGYMIKSIHPVQKLSFHITNSTNNFPSLCRDIWDRHDKITIKSYSHYENKELPDFWKNTRRGLENPPGIKDWKLSLKGNQQDNPCLGESPWELMSMSSAILR